MTRLARVQTQASGLLLLILAIGTGIFAGICLFVAPDKVIAGTAMLAALSGVAFMSWRNAPASSVSRATIAIAMMGLPAVLTFMMSGRAWQLDMHMTFFASLAIVTLLCDWRALLAAAGATALHHLALNFLLPWAVFPEGGDFARVVLHAVIVVGQTAALIWLSHRITVAFEEAEQAIVTAEAANEQARALMATERERDSEREQARQVASAAARTFQDGVKSVLGEIETASAEMAELAGKLTSDARETRTGADSSAKLAQDTSAHVQSVASAAQELAASISEVARVLEGADAISERAAEEATRAGSSIHELNTAAREIEDIARLVGDIAEQTNLLALNATIEAARAGDAGKGFAVVASEVKALADQTAKATGNISSRIEALCKAADGAGEALERIGKTIEEVRQASGSAHDNFAEQSGATGEIARLASSASQSTDQVGAQANTVTAVAQRTETAARRFEAASGNLREAAGRLDETLQTFTRQIEAA
jgi:methyl-accepting chemotaxis protein